MKSFGNTACDKGSVTIKVNPKIYPLEAVYSAAYTFLDKAYILLDGDPEKEILVNIKPKGNCPLETIGNEFSNELLNYSDYLARAKETRNAREMILRRAMFPQNTELPSDEGSSEEDVLEDFEDIDNDIIEDPEGISIPWEEKYEEKSGKEKCNNQDENKAKQ